MDVLTNDSAVLGIAWFVVFVISVSCHEASHAWAGFRLGDPTAFYHGQMSLHPLAHIRREPFGMVIVPIVSYVIGGWMIGWGSAPYDPAWADRYPRREALMSLSGPAANFLLVLLASAGVHIGITSGLFFAPESVTFTSVVGTEEEGLVRGLAIFVSILFSLNVLLFVFNLLPVPPLDGTGWVTLLLPAPAATRFRILTVQPWARFLGLFLVWNFFGFIADPLWSAALGILYPGSHWS